MEKELQERLTRRKYFTALIGLLILTILMAIKPAVNNVITNVYYWVSFASVSLITFLITTFRYYDSKKFAYKVFYLTDFFSLFIVACCVFQFIFVFGYFKADVDGISMYPTLKDHNVLIVRSTNDVDNFDIIIVEYDNKKNIEIGGIENKELLVKRLIAKGGDSFTIRNGVLVLNGKTYSEDYVFYKDKYNSLNPNLKKFIDKGLTYDSKYDRYIVSEGYYFVLGDNRDDSIDSRIFGLITKDQIVGRVDYRINRLFDWERLS